MALTPGPAGKLSLFDPLDGVRDLERRVLRAASAASFSSDPIRTLRAVRMCVQFGLQIDPQTRTWLCRAVPQLHQVSAERIRDEWFRILEQRHAASALSELYRLGLLAEIAPPIVSLAQVPAPYPHDGNALDHAIATVRAVEHLWEAFSGEPSSPALRPLGKALPALASQMVRRYESAICDNRTRLALLKCAALVHGLAQPHGSAWEQEASSPHLGAKVAKELAQSWRCSRAEVNLLGQVVLYHAQPTILAQQMPLTKRAIYRFYRDAGEHGVDAAFVALASYLAAWKESPPTAGWDRQLETVKSLWAAYWQHRETLIAPRPLLSGHDLLALGLEPGPEIGKLLARLREEQAAGQIHSRQQALELVRQWSIG
jgi:tRNA nucleotidyltransferase/poly(A) polymerase